MNDRASAVGLTLGAAVFVSAVASNAASVHYTLPAAAVSAAGNSGWPILFAAGQIVGPKFIGWMSLGATGLTRGLAASALLLAVGAVQAALQRPLSAERP